MEDREGILLGSLGSLQHPCLMTLCWHHIALLGFWHQNQGLQRHVRFYAEMDTVFSTPPPHVTVCHRSLPPLQEGHPSLLAIPYSNSLNFSRKRHFHGGRLQPFPLGKGKRREGSVLSPGLAVCFAEPQRLASVEANSDYSVIGLSRFYQNNAPQR